MKILTCWPPHVPSYFNAGHHLPVFSIAAYLREQGHEVDALDAGVLNCTWKEFGAYVYRGGYELVVLVNDFDVVEGLRRAADYVRVLLPQAVIITVGRLSYQNPLFFRQFELDAVAMSGDYEAAVREVLRWINQGRSEEARPAGVAIRTGDGWQEPARPGIRLDPSEWVFPSVADIPYHHYDKLYRDDQDKFCGIPKRRELVVPVARGCPIGCEFCDVPTMQGLRERRVCVAQTVRYIVESFETAPFEYVSFYAPTFTLNRKWVLDLCEMLERQERCYPWKCATTLHHLDEGLVSRMAAAGCVRISLGIETLEPEAAQTLPTCKREHRARFETVARWCRDSGVELNCFVIVGLPGTTVAGTRETVAMIAAAGARVRPTLYTPYDRMHGGMSEREVSAFNRHLFVDGSLPEDQDPLEFLSFVFGDDAYETSVPEKILSLTPGSRPSSPSR
jgi:anaerobic magnesium-protoporphyrin IX monomethyl ester cyclase